ncbi:MAG: hypothetical protein EP318_01615 [Rhodobacteraceae bacterium]|nr:MAG: hypothetical protein EP318_01615 [Paracoccaceae bacterium]
MTSAHLELAQDFLRRVWEEGDSAAIYEMFTGETSVHGLEEMHQVGPEAFHSFHRMMTAQFRDIRHEVLQALEQGAWVALLCDITAVYRETGTPVATRTQIMMRIQQGRIVEAHNQIDLIPIFEAIGRLPPRTVDLCLLGGRMELRRPA